MLVRTNTEPVLVLFNTEHVRVQIITAPCATHAVSKPFCNWFVCSNNQAIVSRLKLCLMCVVSMMSSSIIHNSDENTSHTVHLVDCVSVVELSTACCVVESSMTSYSVEVVS